MRAVGETLNLIGQAMRLLLRHWPTLLVLAFAGMMARQLLLKLAVLASDVHKVLGMLVFALVPLGLLIALLLMLRTLRESLPAVAALANSRPHGSGQAHLASVLIPFLVVYASFDYFVDDRSDYAYYVFVDEVASNGDIFVNPASSDMSSRLIMERLDWVTVTVVGVAVLLRWLLGLWKAGRRNAIVGFSSAYLEVVWMTLAFITLSVAKEDLLGRRLPAWTGSEWEGFVAGLGSLSWAAEFAAGTLLVADQVIIVPLAWLAVGAILYGRSLDQGNALLTSTARRRWVRMPRALRSDVSDSFGPLAQGLGLLRHGGLAPMLLFCLVFLAAQMLPSALFFAERALIGPRDLLTIWMPLSFPLSTINDSIGAMVLTCLVAVAVNRVLGLAPRAEAATPHTTSNLDVQPGISGQAGTQGDPYRHGPGVAGQDEENQSLIQA